jgi:hypothetical protein
VEYKWAVPDHGDGSDSGATGARLFVRPSFADFERIELRRQRSASAKRVYFGTTMLVPPGVHCHLFEVILPGQGGADRGGTEGPDATLLCSSEEESQEDFTLLPITEPQRIHLQRVCLQMRYSGPINVRVVEEEGNFQIPENTPPEDPFEVEPDPWAESLTYTSSLRSCFQADLPQLRLGEICRASEEAEVKEVLWSVYDHLYETYAIYAGRSQWPLVRNTDVYAFFDEAKLLHVSDPAASISDAARDAGDTSPKDTAAAEGPALLSPHASTDSSRLPFQDVKLILMQTRAKTDRRLDPDSIRKPSHKRRVEIQQQQNIEGAPLNRPQFIEMLVRTAVATRQDSPSVAVALRSFVDNILVARIFQLPLARFPRGLQNQPGEVRDKLLAGRKTLLEAHERFGSSEGAFQRFAQLLRITDQNFTAKHVASLYSVARLPNPTAIQKPASIALKYNEFCEAVARMSLTWRSDSRATQRLCRTSTSTEDGFNKFGPFDLQHGQPVRQKAFAAHIEAFIAKVGERLKPAVKVSPGLL